MIKLWRSGLSLALMALMTRHNAMSTPFGSVTSMKPVSQTFDITPGRITTLKFACIVDVNATLGGNATSPAETVSPLLLYHNDQEASLFTSNDCSTATMSDLSNWIFTPQVVSLSAGQVSNVVTVAWSFCYRPLSTNDDYLTFECVTNTNLISPTGKLVINVNNGGISAKGVYFGMAPFVFVFALILLCNVMIWRRMMARRMQQQHRDVETRGPQVGMPGTISGITAPRSVPTGLTPEAIAGIPVKEVPENDSQMTKDMCVICQSEYEAKEKYKELKCNHKFHTACIDAWLAKSAHCPICVADLTIV